MVVHNEIRFHVPEQTGPVVSRIVDILARRVREYSGARVVTEGEGDLAVHLAIKPSVGAEGFSISDDPSGGVRIEGNDEPGLLFGIGKFLRDASYTETGFTPGAWRGTSVPKKQVRGIYFATHFFNYYHVCPIEEFTRYVEDLSLWGLNAFSVWFDMHHFNGIDDPKAREMIQRLRAILQTARDLGLRTGLTTIADEGYANSPVELRADWTAGHDGYTSPPGGHYHVELCPNKPGAIELELKWFQERFDAFKDIGIDYLWLWPFDQGGCTCSQCKPWGANGFLKISEPVARLFRREFPNGKVVLSTWYFDHFTTGEWEGLTEALRKNPPDWVDYVLADDIGGVPSYVLERGVPGGKPLVGFPEISMYGMNPWGGFGANPMPERFQRLWDEARGKLDGGFPYSEGIYEDINKVIYARFYWDPEAKAGETVREYVAFHFSPAVVDEVSRAIAILERNHIHYLRDADGRLHVQMESTEGADEALRLMCGADAKLPQRVRHSWRWRILYLRAQIDNELRKTSGRIEGDVLRKAFTELTEIYHAWEAAAWVRPPSIGGPGGDGS